MIYLLHGTDKDKARSKAGELVAGLRAKRPDASFFKMTDDSWSDAAFDEYVSGQGLFEQKYIVLFDGVFGLKEAKEKIAAAATLKQMKESPHVFIFREDELDKATLGKFEKSAVKAQEFGEKIPAGGARGSIRGAASASRGKKEFSVFSLTDALGDRDRKGLWVLYQKAKKSGLEDEQIHGTLFWQVKSMIIAADAASAGEAKLNPFVYAKAKSFARNFQKNELTALSGRLVSLYHDSRRGIHDLDHAVERFILSV